MHPSPSNLRMSASTARDAFAKHPAVLPDGTVFRFQFNFLLGSDPLSSY